MSNKQVDLLASLGEMPENTDPQLPEGFSPGSIISKGVDKADQISQLGASSVSYTHLTLPTKRIV